MGGLVIIFILWSFVPRERLIVLIKEVFIVICRYSLKPISNNDRSSDTKYLQRNLQYKYTCVYQTLVHVIFFVLSIYFLLFVFFVKSITLRIISDCIVGKPRIPVSCCPSHPVYFKP